MDAQTLASQLKSITDPKHAYRKGGDVVILTTPKSWQEAWKRIWSSMNRRERESNRHVAEIDYVKEGHWVGFKSGHYDGVGTVYFGICKYVGTESEGVVDNAAGKWLMDHGYERVPQEEIAAAVCA